MKFRFLVPHHLDRIYAAGEVAEVPADFVPSGQVEPLDQEALATFHALGPQTMGYVFNGFRVAAPKTRWVSDPIEGSVHRRWRLTGLGAHLQCDFCD
jgi:hypothetical protein